MRICALIVVQYDTTLSHDNQESRYARIARNRLSIVEVMEQHPQCGSDQYNNNRSSKISLGGIHVYFEPIVVAIVRILELPSPLDEEVYQDET